MNQASLKSLLRDAERWSEQDRAELVDYARVIEARRNGLYRVSDSERAAITEALEQADRDELISAVDLAESEKRDEP